MNKKNEKFKPMWKNNQELFDYLYKKLSDKKRELLILELCKIFDKNPTQSNLQALFFVKCAHEEIKRLKAKKRNWERKIKYMLKNKLITQNKKD